MARVFNWHRRRMISVETEEGFEQLFPVPIEHGLTLERCIIRGTGRFRVEDESDFNGLLWMWGVEVTTGVSGGVPPDFPDRIANGTSIEPPRDFLHLDSSAIFRYDNALRAESMLPASLQLNIDTQTRRSPEPGETIMPWFRWDIQAITVNGEGVEWKGVIMTLTSSEGP